MYKISAVILILLISGCASKNEARSLICFGFCTEQAFNRDVESPSKEVITAIQAKKEEKK